MTWWRAHDDAVDDPKLQKLSGDLFKQWFNLLCLTSRNKGFLPPISDIAIGLRVTIGEANDIVSQLMAAGLIDERGGKLQPHNWEGRQFKSDISTDRVRRFRKRLRIVS